MYTITELTSGAEVRLPLWNVCANITAFAPLRLEGFCRLTLLFEADMDMEVCARHLFLSVLPLLPRCPATHLHPHHTHAHHPSAPTTGALPPLRGRGTLTWAIAAAVCYHVGGRGNILFITNLCLAMPHTFRQPLALPIRIIISA